MAASLSSAGSTLSVCDALGWQMVRLLFGTARIAAPTLAYELHVLLSCVNLLIDALNVKLTKTSGETLFARHEAGLSLS